MLHIVRKSVTVQKIGLLTLGKSAQTFVQLTHGFFVHINLFRRFDGRISNSFDAKQPFLTGRISSNRIFCKASPSVVLVILCSY